MWLGKAHSDARTFETPVRVSELDARYVTDRLELRAVWARVGLPRADAVNQAVGRMTGVDPNIARGIGGYYAEASYRVLASGPACDLVAFGRYERADTQRRMPEGWLPLEAFNRHQWVAGLTYYPDPDVAVKVDYTRLTNRSGVVRSPSSFNIGLGWWF